MDCDHLPASKLTSAENLELAFTLAFDVEMIIRIVGHFPDWRTFASSGRNDFDLFLAVGCSTIQIPAISSHRVYPWLTIFQLLRWYRFILAFPRMKPLLVGVRGNDDADPIGHGVRKFLRFVQHGYLPLFGQLSGRSHGTSCGHSRSSQVC